MERQNDTEKNPRKQENRKDIWNILELQSFFELLTTAM